MKGFINYLRGAYRRLTDHVDLFGMLFFLGWTLFLTLIISILSPEANEDMIWAGCCIGGLILKVFRKPNPPKARSS